MVSTVLLAKFNFLGTLTAINEGAKEKIAYSEAIWSRDNKGIFVTCDFGGEFKQLKYYDLQAKSFTKDFTSDIPWDISQLSLSPSGTQLLFTANEDGVTTLYITDVS
jgi:hypothetical protein